MLFAILSLTFLPAHGVVAPKYLAGVSPGSFTAYQVLRAVYSASDPAFNPEDQSVKDFNATLSATETVTKVDSSTVASNVTGSESLIFNNATGVRTNTFFADLLTGAGNATFFIIAGGLTKGDAVNNKPGAPTINETKSMTYLGATRQVNVYNFTYVLSGTGPYYVFAKIHIFWDQVSGVALEVSIYENLATPGPSGIATLYENVDVAIAATNIWTPQPDFLITANPFVTTFSAGSTGSSLITASSLFGFAGTVSLSTSVNSTSLTATCGTLTPIDPVYYLTASSSCTLSSSTTGKYDVTVTGTSGTLTHSLSIIVTVTAAPDFSLATNISSMTLVGSAIGTVAVTISAVNGFSGTVNLSDDISSAGLTCTLSPDKVTLTATTH